MDRSRACEGLGPLLDTAEVVAGHDEVGRDDAEPATDSEPPRVRRPPRSEEIPGAVAVMERCEVEDPDQSKTARCCACQLAGR